MTVSTNYAASAYRDATRVAEKILDATSSGQIEPSKDTGRPSFTELLTDSLQTARDVGYKGEDVSTKSIANQADLHDLITAVSSSELTLNTVVAVRDRVVSAYQEILRMPI